MRTKPTFHECYCFSHGRIIWRKWRYKALICENTKAPSIKIWLFLSSLCPFRCHPWDEREETDTAYYDDDEAPVDAYFVTRPDDHIGCQGIPGHKNRQKISKRESAQSCGIGDEIGSKGKYTTGHQEAFYAWYSFYNFTEKTRFIPGNVGFHFLSSKVSTYPKCYRISYSITNHDIDKAFCHAKKCPSKEIECYSRERGHDDREYFHQYHQERGKYPRWSYYFLHSVFTKIWHGEYKYTEYHESRHEIDSFFNIGRKFHMCMSIDIFCFFPDLMRLAEIQTALYLFLHLYL